MNCNLQTKDDVFKLFFISILSSQHQSKLEHTWLALALIHYKFVCVCDFMCKYQCMGMALLCNYKNVAMRDRPVEHGPLEKSFTCT